MISVLRSAIEKIPTREERLGGQTFKYVKLSEVLDLLDTFRSSNADETTDVENLRNAVAAMRSTRDEMQRHLIQQESEIDKLRAALIYSAFAQHKTPQYMLPEGIALINGDAVEVTVNGVRVYAGPERSAEEPVAFTPSQVAQIVADNCEPCNEQCGHSPENGSEDQT